VETRKCELAPHIVQASLFFRLHLDEHVCVDCHPLEMVLLGKYMAASPGCLSVPNSAAPSSLLFLMSTARAHALGCRNLTVASGHQHLGQLHQCRYWMGHQEVRQGSRPCSFGCCCSCTTALCGSHSNPECSNRETSWPAVDLDIRQRTRPCGPGASPSKTRSSWCCSTP
jgi:hypothetical protein